MSELVKTERMPVEHQDAIRTALQTSLYPGASPASVDMVLAYCRAAGLDPMQKPVHIVPMWDNKARVTRDVVMPGIGLYRTNAARTGQFAGISEPEFGPMVTERLGGRDVTFPEWCRVTAYRQLPSGHVAKFTAVEYWVENYAIKGGKEQDQSPNAMWSKRVRGQLAKCAQAQALRMAFPEAVGAGPTAEEMEGKPIIEHDPIAHDSGPSPTDLAEPWMAKIADCETLADLEKVGAELAAVAPSKSVRSIIGPAYKARKLALEELTAETEAEQEQQA